jgi:hypothetical protein
VGKDQVPFKTVPQNAVVDSPQGTALAEKSVFGWSTIWKVSWWYIERKYIERKYIRWKYIKNWYIERKYIEYRYIES